MNVVLAANAETALHAKRVGCRRVELFCDTGLRDDYASPSPRNFSPASPIRLLWVGRFLPRKGLLLALDAVAEAKDSIELSLVGSGLDQTLVWRAVKERHLEGRVHWEGTRLSWQQVRDAYNTHDALLFTSIRDTFGSQNLEAMSVGLPIIYLNLSGAKDFIPAGAGIGAEVGPTLSSTVANLRSAINRFSELTVTERNRMSHVAWTASKAFRWPERADAVYKLYEESCALSTNAVSI